MFDTKLPQRIICLTEESVELLYAIGEERRIVGVSAFVERPEVAKKLPRVSGFTHANLKKIVDLKPDLVLGYCDIQKDIARDLIGMGLNVFISNHRSLKGVFDYCQLLGTMVGQEAKTEKYLSHLKEKCAQAKKTSEARGRRFKVYLEEWNDPMISAIQYFSELVELCGGDNIFLDNSEGILASDRFVSWDEVTKRNPDYILACWCGKKVDMDEIYGRGGEIEAIKRRQIHELPPAVFLQPGPALFEEGIDLLLELFSN